MKRAAGLSEIVRHIGCILHVQLSCSFQRCHGALYSGMCFSQGHCVCLYAVVPVCGTIASFHIHNCTKHTQLHQADILHGLLLVCAWRQKWQTCAQVVALHSGRVWRCQAQYHQAPFHMHLTPQHEPHATHHCTCSDPAYSYNNVLKTQLTHLLQAVENCRNVGNDTLAALEGQGRQLDKMKQEYDAVDEHADHAESTLAWLARCCWCCNCCRPDTKPQKGWGKKDFKPQTQKPAEHPRSQARADVRSPLPFCLLCVSVQMQFVGLAIQISQFGVPPAHFPTAWSLRKSVCNVQMWCFVCS